MKEPVTIRTAAMEDLEVLTAIEAACFPAAEAAKEEDFRRRLAVYPDRFWLLEREGEVISFVNGLVTDEAELRDEMYEQAQLHDPAGAWQMIFGVNTLPQYRDQGFAGILIRRCIETARAEGKKGVVLTCKDRLVGYYEKFGFVSEGVSGSTHGGVTWYSMRLTF